MTHVESLEAGSIRVESSVIEIRELLCNTVDICHFFERERGKTAEVDGREMEMDGDGIEMEMKQDERVQGKGKTTNLKTVGDPSVT